jgi:hypothetical protein
LRQTASRTSSSLTLRPSAMSTSIYSALSDSLLERGGNAPHKTSRKILCCGLFVVKRAPMLFCVPMLSAVAMSTLTRHIAEQ